MEAAIPKESMLSIEEWPDWRRPLAKNSAAILSPLHRHRWNVVRRTNARDEKSERCARCACELQRFAKSAVSGEIVSDTRREQRGTTRLEIFVSSERRGIVLPSTIPLLCVDACDRTTRQNSATRAQNQKYDGTKDGGSSDQRIQRDRRLDKGAERQGERSMRDDGRGHETTDHEPRDRRRRERV